MNVPDPDDSNQILEQEILESQPMVVQDLVDQSFRAVDVIAGDSVSVALGIDGDLRVWGSFRVKLFPTRLSEFSLIGCHFSTGFGWVAWL